MAAKQLAYADEALYRLQAGDTIEIWVGQDTSLNRQVIVQPDGRIILSGDHLVRIWD